MYPPPGLALVAKGTGILSNTITLFQLSSNITGADGVIGGANGYEETHQLKISIEIAFLQPMRVAMLVNIANKRGLKTQM